MVVNMVIVKIMDQGTKEFKIFVVQEIKVFIEVESQLFFD